MVVSDEILKDDINDENISPEDNILDTAFDTTNDIENIKNPEDIVDVTKEEIKKEIREVREENSLIIEETKIEESSILEPEMEEEKNPETQKEIFESITKKQYKLFGDINSAETEINEIQSKISEIETKIEEIKNENIEISNDSKILEEVTEEKEIENIKEIEIKEEPVIYKPKHIDISFLDNMGKFETAPEIKYTSLKLSNFPIKVSNVIEGMTFPYEFVIGSSSIKIGDQIINNCNLRVISNESVKILEIKHREFKLGLSVSLNGDTIKAYGNIRTYEISSLIKHSRMLKVLEMFSNIFNGLPISFKVKRLYADIVAEDRIELMRIKTIESFFENIDASGYKFDINNLPNSKNVYYLLELNSALRNNKTIETWCNFNIDTKDYNIHSGDTISFTRTHEINKNLSILEKITLKNPLDENNIFTEKIVGYRKPCLIEISKI